eukprot:COSAG01_NODE_1329_length_10704_cov_34.202074_5_plen_332_part_00
MGKIAKYPIVTPQGDDKIIVSQTTGTPENATKNITVNGLASYIGTGNQIPTPELYTMKRRPEDGVNWGINSALCIKGLQGDNLNWVVSNPTARLFMYTRRQSKSTDQTAAPSNKITKRGGWVHPSHMNGDYTRKMFGFTNWGTGVQQGDNPNGGKFDMHPIVTEWNIDTDLKVARSGAQADFSDPTLYETTHIEVPFNQLQFLVNRYTTPGTTSSEYTDFNYPTGINIFKAGTDLVRPRNSIKNLNSSVGWNTNTPFNLSGVVQVSKIVFRLVVGIENPNFSLTNHTIPYIFGEPSNPITLVYQRSFTGTEFVNSIMTVGHSNNIPRANGF